MSYPESIRQFYLEASGNRCEYEFYDEKKGWQRCKNRKKLQVHHITPQGVTLQTGGNPDESEALVLCESHHVRNTSDKEHSVDFSFHPDMGYAYKSYGEWKNSVTHLESITGRKITNIPSPFEETAREHKLKAQKCERYHAGTPEIDEYYRQKSSDGAVRHIAETGTKRPETHHKLPFKPKPSLWEWAKDLFGGDKDGE